jgi:hypothetical protein
MATVPITLAGHQADTTFRSADQTRSVVPAKLAGLAIATLVPALFWTATVWGIGHAFGVEISTRALITIAAAITAFLSVICSAMLATD